MGQNQPSVLQVMMQDYRIDRRQPEEQRTYLTHTDSQKQYLFKEFTLHELREFSLTSEKLKARQKLSSLHLSRLQS
jgi:hypothetical protein